MSGGQKGTRYLWMAVSADKYELPLAVGRSAAELARAVGVTTSTIATSEFKKLTGKNRGWRVEKIPLPPGEEQEYDHSR